MCDKTSLTPSPLLAHGSRSAEGEVSQSAKEGGETKKTHEQTGTVTAAGMQRKASFCNTSKGETREVPSLPLPLVPSLRQSSQSNSRAARLKEKEG